MGEEFALFHPQRWKVSQQRLPGVSNGHFIPLSELLLQSTYLHKRQVIVNITSSRDNRRQMVPITDHFYICVHTKKEVKILSFFK